MWSKNKINNKTKQNYAKKIKKIKKKEQKEVLIPEELKKSFTKTPGPRSTDKPFSVWFSDIVFHHHPVNLKMF